MTEINSGAKPVGHREIRSGAVDGRPSIASLTRLLPNDLRPGNVRRFLKPGALAVADQGFSALASLAINLMLIRWLVPDQYGAFAVCFSWILLLGGVQNSILFEPMLVFGADRYKDDFPAYLRMLALGHWPVSVVLSVPLLVAGATAHLLGAPTLGMAFIGATLSLPGLMFFQLARRVCYLRGDLRPAAAGGVLYLLFTVTGMFALSSTGLLSTFAALALMGLAGFAVGAVVLHRQGVPVRGAGRRLPMRPVAREHWNYGRWAIGSTLAGWVPGNVYFLALPVLVGLEAAGILAALMLFLRPVMTVVEPLALMMVPRLVRMGRNGGHTLRPILIVTFLFLTGATLYWGMLCLEHDALVGWVLGAHYLPHSSVLVVLGGIAPTLAAVSVLASGLRATLRPDLEFRAHFFSAVVAVVVGLPLVSALHVTGAALGLIASYAAAATALVFFLLKLRATSVEDDERRPSR